MRIDGPFIVDIYKTKIFLIICIMALFTISSALGVVYSKHKTRMLHVKLQGIYIERSNLNTEWSRLLLEKSTWMADFRVEQLAKQNLHMIMPEQVYIIRQ